MRKVLLSLTVILLCCCMDFALDRQPGTDYHARREALSKKASGVVVLIAPLESSDSAYTFRQSDDFYYLSGITMPKAALVIAAGREARGNAAARPYTEILFLPTRDVRIERYTGPQLRGDDPEAPKITGFDRVEDISRLPEEVSALLAGQPPIVFAELPTPDNPSASDAIAFLQHSIVSVYFQEVKPMLAS